ncbi:MAG: rubrerythrin family protein, partial [Bacteroidales bacterium]|nr:rubrerythrin family protein [Bacteroidales bacterium]
MTKSIKGTETEKNLMCSFAGECQARMRYTYFASAAKKEGFEQIAAIFTETADQEKEHAKRMFKFLEGGTTEITASFPSGVIGRTLDNLQAAAAGELEEWSDLYPAFAETAEKEGFPEIAMMYHKIAVAEKGHEQRYRAFVSNIETASV